MLRAIRSLFRRPAPTTVTPSDPAGHAEFLDVLPAPGLLPVRTPGLVAARRHTWSGVRHGLGALRDVDAWADARHDPARATEADVRHLAALHQLDTAIAELRTARRALAATTKEPCR